MGGGEQSAVHRKYTFYLFRKSANWDHINVIAQLVNDVEHISDKRGENVSAFSIMVGFQRSL